MILLCNTSITYIPLPCPYNNYIFKRINTYTGWIDDHIPVMNTTNSYIQNPTNTYYLNVSQSLPNTIFTSGENLSITKTRNRIFNIQSLYMTSILIDNMGIIFKEYKFKINYR